MGSGASRRIDMAEARTLAGDAFDEAAFSAAAAKDGTIAVEESTQTMALHGMTFARIWSLRQPAKGRAGGGFDLSIDAIKQLAKDSTAMHIRDANDPAQFVTTKDGVTWPCKMLAAGYAFSTTPDGSSVTVEIMKETWEGSMVGSMFNAGVERQVLGPRLYHACNNGGGLHLFAGRECEFRWEDPGAIEVWLGRGERTTAPAAAADGAAPLHVIKPTWEEFGGRELEPLFDCTTVIDARWLLRFAKGEVMPEREGVVPAWQELPEEAAVGLDVLRRSNWNYGLPIGVLSYGWASKGHPDPTGEQLRRLVPFLEAVLKRCDDGGYMHGEMWNPAAAPTWGIVWDFMSLPQRGYTRGYSAEADDRTPAQLERFGSGLKNINVWYAAKYSYTLCLNTPMPANAQNQARYDTRGWCLFERAISCLVKHNDNFFELGKMSGNHDTWYGLMWECALQARRPAPMAPDAFDAMMTAGVAAEAASPGSGIRFTSGKDLTAVVLPQYRTAFLRLMTETDSLVYQGLQWHDAEAQLLAASLAFATEKGACKKVVKLNVAFNELGDAGFRALAAALEKGALPALQVLHANGHKASPSAAKELLTVAQKRGVACNT